MCGCCARRPNLGDFLVVGLNSDASVRRLKGPSRPINPAEARAEVLSALKAVDAVTVFDEDTPLELITAIRPDVLVKGGDYRPEQVVGRAEVEAAGGRLVLIPLVEGHSTTTLVHRASERADSSPRHRITTRSARRPSEAGQARPRSSEGRSADCRGRSVLNDSDPCSASSRRNSSASSSSQTDAPRTRPRRSSSLRSIRSS